MKCSEGAGAAGHRLRMLAVILAVLLGLPLLATVLLWRGSGSSYSASWTLNDSGGQFIWSGQLPGRERGDLAEWRARAWWGVPGFPRLRLLADSGNLTSDYFPNNPMPLASFPVPGSPGVIDLELSCAINGVRTIESGTVRLCHAVDGQAIESAVRQLGEELIVAAGYGVVWPEAEAVARALEASPEAGSWELSAAEWARAGLESRRSAPELWRPLPARSLAEVEFLPSGPVRRAWTPAGATESPIMLAGSLLEPRRFGASVWLVKKENPAEPVDARRENVALLAMGEDVLPDGIWAPLELDSTSVRERMFASFQLLAAQRHEAVLAGLRWDRRAYRGQSVFTATGTGWLPAEGETVPFLLEARGTDGLAIEVDRWYLFLGARGEPALGLAFLLPAVDEAVDARVDLGGDSVDCDLFTAGKTAGVVFSAEGETLESFDKGPLDLPGVAAFRIR